MVRRKKRKTNRRFKVTSTESVRVQSIIKQTAGETNERGYHMNSGYG